MPRPCSCDRVQPEGAKFDKEQHCHSCTLWVRFPNSIAVRAWKGETVAQIRESLTPTVSGMVQAKQSAPKKCGGCGSGKAPLRVARPQAAQPQPQARPWSAPGPLDQHFNPSIIEWKGRLLLCSRKGRVNSRLFLTALNDDLSPAAGQVALQIDHPRCKAGQEDPRFFVHRGRLHLGFCGVELIGGKAHTWQLVAELRDDLKVEKVWHVQYPHRTWPMEKNWQWFEDDGELRCLYSVEPHRVLAVKDGKAEKLALSQPGFEWKWGQMRGGAGPVRVGDEFWHFFHSTGQQEGKPFYTMGLYTFEARAPYRVRRFIPEPLLVGDRPNDEGKRVVFPCGAVLRQGKVIVSYGWNDVAVRFAQWDQEELEKRLVPVGSVTVP